MTEEFGFEVKLENSYDDAVKAVTQALKTEGFGVLTEIDVKDTLKKKLDEDFRPYVILGACNPPLAHQALSAAPEVGMLLPCNVTVEAAEDGGSLIRIINPKMMMGMGSFANNPALMKVADQAYEKLARVADALAAK